MTGHPHFAALDRLKTRIQGLRSKTTDNGCTEAEALLAAAKVAELLDRYDLSLTDVEIRDARCERREYETYRKKRIPLDDCVGAIANFCDCRVWREKNQAAEARYVFFGLRSDIEVAHYLTELIDNAVRSEVGRYKNSAAYRRFRHQDRHVANSSFTLGMVASIADKLTAMKRERDAVNNGTGRDLVVLKASVVDAELGKDFASNSAKTAGPNPKIRSLNERHRLRDLLLHDGLDFVENAYRTILRRDADPAGRSFYLKRLQGGSSKIGILGDLRYSAEGRTLGTAISGLEFQYRLQRLSRRPCRTRRRLAVRYGSARPRA